MYFSRNSRSVFQKARALSSKFSVAGKNFSYKTPKDDPTKPALRVNIPKDILDQEEPLMQLSDVNESKSVKSSTYEYDILHGGNDYFPTVIYNDELGNDNLEKTLAPTKVHEVTYETVQGINPPKKENRKDVSEWEEGKILLENTLQTDKIKVKRQRKFKVIEEDDPVTYVFHGKSHRTKKDFTRTWRVPERVPTQHENESHLQQEKRTEGEQQEMRTEEEQQGMRMEGEEQEMRTEGEEQEMRLEGEQQEMTTEGEQQGMRTAGEQQEMKLEGEQQEMTTEGEQQEMRLEGEQQEMILEGEQQEMRMEGEQQVQKVVESNSQDDNAVSTAEEDFTERNEKAEETCPYLSIYDLKSKHIPKDSQKSKKKFMASSHKKYGGQSSNSERLDTDAVNFHTAASYICFGCDKIPTNYGAAFPPLLNEALINRFKFKKGLFSSDKLRKCFMTSDMSKPSQSGDKKLNEFSENSILFPKNENFDCESLFTTREDIILNLIKNSEAKKPPQTTQMTVESYTEKGGSKSVDSLSVMKKVRDIVQFDLDNAVKIFKDGEPVNCVMEVSSVVLLKEDGWKVDVEELSKQMQQRKLQMECKETPSVKTDISSDLLGDKILEKTFPKYLPSGKSFEMKLSSDSAMTFNPETNEFSVNKEALSEAISRRAKEPIPEVQKTVEFLSSDKAPLQLKHGDSILVFDEETQTWKVDFSILEKREQQLQIEKELTKTSELILETFEKFEKDHPPKVEMPTSRETKTFDYKKEEWNSYNPENKAKSKSPFKESNAEEIRKKNSDLYENLFIANKKDSGITDTVEPPTNPKKAASDTVLEKQASEKGSGSKNSGTTSDNKTVPPEPSKRSPELPENKNPPPKEQKKDDNYWESFLRSGILPRDISEIAKIRAPPPPPPPPPTRPPPVSKTPTKPPTVQPPPLSKTPAVQPPPVSKTPTVQPPQPKTPTPSPPTTKTPPGTKIEVPKFKIRIPFIKDRISKTPKPSNPTPSIPQDGGTPQKRIEEPQKKSSTGNIEGPLKIPPLQSPPAPSGPLIDKSPTKPPTTIGSTTPTPKPDSGNKPSKPEPKASDKNLKMSPSAEHYVSDKIIEISRNKASDGKSKILANKVETVKVNITTGGRQPSKVTEINLNKQTIKKQNEPSVNDKQPSEADKKKFYKKFEKYRTPFSEPDYEEKAEKIRSDMESNPNLKKLDNWNKTIVLHDIVKPPENMENWLKSETDKMTSLLLKVLNEAGDGKQNRKPPKNKGEKQLGKGNPYDNIRKKQENNTDDFLFRVRTMNLSAENKTKEKSEEKTKGKEVKSVRSKEKQKVVELRNLPSVKKEGKTTPLKSSSRSLGSLEALKAKTDAEETALMSKEYSQVARIPMELTEDVPGPEILKKISNTFKFLPIAGSQLTVLTLLKLFQLGKISSSFLSNQKVAKIRGTEFTELFTKYGPIVNVQSPLSGNAVFIQSPEHFNSVLEQDVPMVTRSIFDSLEHFRREFDEIVTSQTIFTDWSKPQWNDLRRVTNDPLVSGSEKYFDAVNVAGDSLLSSIRRNGNARQMVSVDYMEDLKRWSLEGVCNVIFEKSFGFLEGKSKNLSFEANKMYQAVEEANTYLNKCEKGFQMWRFMNTSSGARLSRAYQSLSGIFSKQFYQSEMSLMNKQELLKNGAHFVPKNLTFIESMMLNDGMTVDDITCNLVDIILTSTNMMSSTLAFLLYHLSQSTKTQKRLCNEMKEILRNKDSQLNYQNLSSMKYLQACLKECLRLHFPIPVFYRLLQTDILLSNYIIPKSTFVVMDFRVSAMKEQFFEEPEKFIPERWLLEEKWMDGIHPFTAFPFCHGPRAVLAKRVTEMQLMACVAKIIRNFQIEYHYGEIKGKNGIIASPDKPLKFTFTERDS